MKYYVVLESEEEIAGFVDINAINPTFALLLSNSLCSLHKRKIYIELKGNNFVLSSRPEGFDSACVVTFEQYLALQAKKPVKERITAEEAVKVLCEEYRTEKYVDIFGEDYLLDDLTENFTPAEIVSKIADWKDKQAAKINVNEDMIADALDEKFGVGNWTRRKAK